MHGTLYVVGTPIGNLEDITLRALRVFKECDTVLCEDTRVTKKLLAHYEITTPTLSYHGHSGLMKQEKILTLLREGKTLALVSDAGTPGISDPGTMLVRAVRDELPKVHIEAVPGPSALTGAFSVAGVHADSFTFLGFPPHKKGRKTFFESVVDEKRTIVFYESPHRIMKALQSLCDMLPHSRRVSVVRELTKHFEEVVEGSAEEVRNHFTEHADTVRGEFVVIVSS